MNKMSMPKDALIAVTYKCNAKCIMCNIWKENPQNEIEVSEYAKLPTSLKDINITGGEPFLRNDLVEIIDTITKRIPNVRIVISSNGFMTERIVDFMKKIIKINPKACIALSLDGMNEIHSQTRGIPDAFAKVLKTTIELKKAGINDIRYGFTAGKDNVSHLKKTYELAKSLGVEFTMSVVHNSEGYFNIETNQAPDIDELEEQIVHVLKREYKTLNPRKLLRTYYIKGLVTFLKSNQRPLECRAMRDSFYMDNYGNILPCNILDKPIGNIKDSSFEEIWATQKAEGLRSYCKSCNQCWMVCTAKGSIRKQALKVIGEVAKDLIPSRLNWTS